MDNRTDQSEDLQATAEHPARAAPVTPVDSNQSGLTAGPHNDPPVSQGTSDAPATQQSQAAPSSASNEPLAKSSPVRNFTQRMSTDALPMLIGAAGLGLVLLALQRARRH